MRNLYNVKCMFRLFWKAVVIKSRVFAPKRDENGEWRRLHNEELHSLYRSLNIVRVIKSVARMEEGRVAFKMVIGNRAGNRSLERPRRRWEDNIRRSLKK